MAEENGKKFEALGADVSRFAAHVMIFSEAKVGEPPPYLPLRTPEPFCQADRDKREKEHQVVWAVDGKRRTGEEYSETRLISASPPPPNFGMLLPPLLSSPDCLHDFFYLPVAPPSAK